MRKKSGITNQSLLARNLKDTKGRLLVKEVIKSHARPVSIALETG